MIHWCKTYIQWMVILLFLEITPVFTWGFPTIILQFLATILLVIPGDSMGIEEFEDIKGVIRSRKLKDRQYNDQSTKRQTMIHKTLHRRLEWAIRIIPQKNSCSTGSTHRVTLVTNPMISLE